MRSASTFATLAILASACGDSHLPAAPDAAPPPDAYVAPCADGDVAASLQTVPGVTSVTQVACGNGVRGAATCFAIQFAQPVDHRDPDGATFPQRLQLVHRSCAAPTIVADWGYASFGFFDDELSALYETNALWIEHRFQGESVPESYHWRWETLTIENGANDLHRIVSSFRQSYPGRWVSTGASKGGITALYYRYFFPDDVDGTVPYVAPASRQRVDPVYQQYLETTLPNPCAQRLRNLQVETLTSRRDAMLERIRANLSASYAEYYLEAMIGTLDWGYWQASGVESCTWLPPSGATDDDVWEFIYDFSGFGQAHPEANEAKSNGALSYEWLTEQGFALQIGRHITQLLHLPDATPTMEQSFRAQFPSVPLPDHDSSVTMAVRAWTRDTAENVLLVYGQFDPWSGGALDQPAHPSSARYFVPGANHGAAITSLPEAEQEAALAHVSRMLGKAPQQRRRAAAARAAAHRGELLDATMRRLTRASATVAR